MRRHESYQSDYPLTEVTTISLTVLVHQTANMISMVVSGLTQQSTYRHKGWGSGLRPPRRSTSLIIYSVPWFNSQEEKSKILLVQNLYVFTKTRASCVAGTIFTLKFF